MNGDPSSQLEDKGAERERAVREIFALAIELSNSREGFPFPGIDQEAYLKIKADEKELPTYITPIDELIKRFES